MRKVAYSMSVSLDGYIVGPDGTFDWPGFDAEVFRFWIDDIRTIGVHLLGRRLYETMLYWETAEVSSLDVEELERLRAEPGEGDIAIGGATLAAEAAAQSLRSRPDEAHAGREQPDEPGGEP
ncbi:MAG TPA: hypothetical protein VLQ68_08310 [Rhizobiaceae bacterium]|nr:hypothetical protein [Rhizobiaceae bacterium]